MVNKMNLNDSALEITIIGTFLAHPKAMNVVGEQIDPEWFADPLMHPIFCAFRDQSNNGRDISFSFLKSELKKHDVPKLQGVNENEILSAIAAEAQIASALPALIAQLKEYWSRRRLVEISDELKEASNDPLLNPAEVATDSAVSLENMSDSDETAVTGTLDHAKLDYFESLKDIDRMRGATTGLRHIDQKIGGYRRGFYYVIAGRPGMGKSAYALSSVFKSAASGSGVYIASLEMSQQEIFARITSELSNRKKGKSAPQYQDMLRGEATEDQLNMVLESSEQLKAVPFIYDTSASLTVAQIKARARSKKAELERQGKTLDIVCVDHMGLIKASGRYKGNKTAETGEISGELRKLAKELDCAVVALSQLSRANTDRDNKRPTLADLRWAGEIEQDAHVVMFVHREVYYSDIADIGPAAYEDLENDMEIIVSKQRNGSVGTVHLDCCIGYNRIDSSSDPYRNE